MIADVHSPWPKGKLLFAFRRLSEKQKNEFICVLCVLSDPAFDMSHSTLRLVGELKSSRS